MGIEGVLEQGFQIHLPLRSEADMSGDDPFVRPESSGRDKVRRGEESGGGSGGLEEGAAGEHA